MTESSPGTVHPLREAMLRRAVPGIVLVLALGFLSAGPWALDRVRTLDAALRGQPAEEALVCSYRLRTGLPCIGCGGTRAFQLTARGQWRAAFAMNVLGASTGASTWVLAVVAAWCSLCGRPRTLLASAGVCAAAVLVILIGQAVQFFVGALGGATG